MNELVSQLVSQLGVQEWQATGGPEIVNLLSLVLRK